MRLQFSFAALLLCTACSAAPVSTTPPLPALAVFEPTSDTLPEVKTGFGQLVGAWRCTGEQRQPDGTMAEGPGESTWTFFYTLGAQAVGDVFEPAPGGGPVGINLRVYDPEAKQWKLAWTTPTLGRYDYFDATSRGADLVMRGELPAKDPFPQHAAQITFYEMGTDSFEWKYEAGAPGSDGPWQLQAMLHCKRA